MIDGKYEVAGEKTLHVWTQPTGERWACVAYDHGPFCRLCQPVDGTLEALLENVVDGLMEVKDDRSGELKFRVTDEGISRVNHMLDGTETEEER